MKVTKHYEQNHIILYVTEGDLQTTITLDSDRQMKRLADCLHPLDREAALREICNGIKASATDKRKEEESV